MKKGIICVGYQGIGKSTLSNRYKTYLDLESGSFYVGDQRASDWYIMYCQVAINLAEQGYVVFVSSHKEVREFLKTVPLPPSVAVVCCVPSEHLKDAWIQKLKDRFETSQLAKDYRAWKNAEDRYIDNVREIKDDFSIVCELPDMEYDLLLELAKTFYHNSLHVYLP